MRLAEKGFDVIATVEIWAQIQTLKRQAAARGVTLKVEKLDVTNEGDRKKALAWDIEILVNNAGVLEGGSVLDIPEPNMRHQFEVNVIGPLLLTQGIAKQMVKRGKGRIVWVSSREGLNTNPFTGIYSASKHAVEAVAETMSLELQEFRLRVTSKASIKTQKATQSKWPAIVQRRSRLRLTSTQRLSLSVSSCAPMSAFGTRRT
jgi:short-subunit dehydrogenase